jgi:hypothetical protein
VVTVPDRGDGRSITTMPPVNKEVIIERSIRSFDKKEDAYDDACEWLEENNIDAEMI